MADSSYIPLYVEAGGLETAAARLSRAKTGFDPYAVFYPGVYENGFYQGDPYLLNKDYSTVAVYANKKLFDAAGIELPQEGWTYDDLLDIAHAAYRRCERQQRRQPGLRSREHRAVRYGSPGRAGSAASRP